MNNLYGYDYNTDYGYNSDNMDEDIGHLMNMQRRYRQQYPGFQIKPPSFFRDFSCENNRNNILTVIKNADEDRIIGFAYLLKIDGNTVNTGKYEMDIIVEPTAEKQYEVYDKLYRRLIYRSKRKKKTGQGYLLYSQSVNRNVFTVNKEASEVKGIDYFKKRDFSVQQVRIFMQQNTNKIKKKDRVSDFKLKTIRWKPDKKCEQFKYLRARNEVFADDPLTLEGLKWFLPLLKTGTAISVLDRNSEIIGSLMVYRTQYGRGIIEDLFVLPQWRRQGIAGYLLTEACSYLRANGIELLELEIDKNNRSALNFYKKANFMVTAEEVYLSRTI